MSFKRLNTSYVSVQGKLGYQDHLNTLFKYIVCVGSRCLFDKNTCEINMFKYIVCVGSRTAPPKTEISSPSLNTSYVSVQDYQKKQLEHGNLFKYIVCVGSRSIERAIELEK